jgi:hypothetical protein
VTLVSDSVLTGQITNGAAKSGYVAVFTTAGADSLPGFTYIPPTPEIWYFTPTSGRPGDTIHLEGNYFTGTTGVSFGGVQASWFQVLNDSMLIAVVGHGASGTVTVAHGFVSGSLSGFTFIEPAPTVGSFSPTSGVQGTSVTIKGYYFTGATAVSFGGTAAASFTVSNDSTLVAVVGTGSTGLVSLTTPQGYGPSLGTFTYLPDTSSPAPPDTTSPTPPSPPDTTAPAPPVPPDSTAPAPPTPPDSTATPAPPPFSVATFYGSVASGESILAWKAINDQTISNYTIQEGADSTQLTTIATVNSQHKDSAIYAFKDPTLRNGEVRYRLLAEDTSGKQVYGAILSLSLPSLTSPAYPNPAVGMLQVSVPNSAANSQFTLADMSGRVLLVVPVSAGTNMVQINVSMINTGTYQLSWSDGSRRKTQTVLIIR